MRSAFVRALMRAAERDPRIWLLTGDLGFSVLEPFAMQFPDRFVNMGIAEQNMTGVAAGMAMAGLIPVTYSIANFPTLRCLEQVRNDVAYHRLNVKIVAVGGGLAYGSLGYTHHAVEDIAAMRCLPSMAVAAPGDPFEAEAVTDAAFLHDGPVYLRIGKAGEPAVHANPVAVGMGEMIPVVKGEDVTLVSTGGVLTLIQAAAQELRNQGVDAGVVSCPWVSPISPMALAQIVRESGRIVCVEEHGRGGLYSAVMECLSDLGIDAVVRSVRLANDPSSVSGSQESLRSQAGVSVASVVAAARQIARYGDLGYARCVA